MSLLRRIVEIWTEPATEEVENTLEEWEFDYAFDSNFMHVISLIREHVFMREYRKAIELFEENVPYDMTEREANLFVWLLEEAEYYE